MCVLYTLYTFSACFILHEFATLLPVLSNHQNVSIFVSQFFFFFAHPFFPFEMNFSIILWEKLYNFGQTYSFHIQFFCPLHSREVSIFRQGKVFWWIYKYYNFFYLNILYTQYILFLTSNNMMATASTWKSITLYPLMRGPCMSIFFG